MQVFLKVRDGLGSRDIAVIEPGTRFTVGRGDHNDVAFPTDPQMSFQHLSIRVQGSECLIEDLNSTNGSLLNGDPVSKARVAHGDVLRCGTTEFIVDFSDQDGNTAPRPEPERRPLTDEGDLAFLAVTAIEEAGAVEQPAKVPAPEFEPMESDGGTARPRRPRPLKRPATEPDTVSLPSNPDIARIRGFSQETAAEIVARFKLQQPLPMTPEDGELPEDYVSRLRPLQNGIPGLKFMAFALPKRCGVWWLVQCVRSAGNLTQAELDLLDDVEVWVCDPSEKNRRAAMAAADDIDMGRPASWTAMAAHHSAGSTAPPDAPAIPAADDVTGKCIFAGVTLATLQGDPQKIGERRSAFTDLAMHVAAGELPWTDNE